MSELPFNVIESPHVPENTIIVLPGPRRMMEIEMPDGTVVRRGETLEEYAQRCVKIEMDQ